MSSLEIFIFFFLIPWLWKLVTFLIQQQQNHSAAIEKYPVLDYLSHSEEKTAIWQRFYSLNHSDEKSAAWRWHRPDKALNLKVLEKRHASILILPDRITFSDKVMVVLCYFFSLCAFFLIFGADSFMEVLVYGFGLFASWKFRYVGIRLVRIELRQHEILFVTCCLSFQHRIRYRRSPRLQIEGKYQPFWKIRRDKEEAFYELFVTKPGQRGLFRFKKRFIIALNQSQCSWIVGGLQQYLKK